MTSANSNTGSDGPEGSSRIRHFSRPSPQRKKLIGELLIEQGLIDDTQLAEALERQKKTGQKVVETLVEMGHLDITTFVKFLAKQPGIPSIDLFNYEIPAEYVGLVPREFAVKHEVFPIDRLGKLLTVGMACPLDTQTIQELEKITGLRVKALLCSAKDIRAAIQRYYPTEAEPVAEEPTEPVPEARILRIEPALKLKRVAALVREIDSLPALPDTVQKVREAMVNPDISVQDVVSNIIRRDPPIAAKLLSVANSAAFGFQSRIASVEQAAALLGLREVYSIVLAAAVEDFFEKCRHFDYKSYWTRSNFCAGAAKAVARACGRGNQPGVYSAGLLYDLGRLVLAEIAANQQENLDDKLDGQELVRAEEESVGLAHAEAGYLLAENWGLPPEIRQSIRYHHAPEQAEEAQDIVAVVSLAAVMTHLREQAAPAEQPFAEAAKALEMLGLTEAQAQEIFEDVLTAPEEY